MSFDLVLLRHLEVVSLCQQFDGGRSCVWAVSRDTDGFSQRLMMSRVKRQAVRG